MNRLKLMGGAPQPTGNVSQRYFPSSRCIFGFLVGGAIAVTLYSILTALWYVEYRQGTPMLTVFIFERFHFQFSVFDPGMPWHLLVLAVQMTAALLLVWLGHFLLNSLRQDSSRSEAIDTSLYPNARGSIGEAGRKAGNLANIV